MPRKFYNMIHLVHVEKANPQDVEAPNKFYAQAVSAGRTDLDRLAYLIANQSTVRKADCLAVLEAFLHNMSDELNQGRIVELGDLGSFRVSISSAGFETADEVSAAAVKSARILFRPGKSLRKLLKTLEYKKVG